MAFRFKDYINLGRYYDFDNDYLYDKYGRLDEQSEVYLLAYLMFEIEKRTLESFRSFKDSNSIMLSKEAVKYNYIEMGGWSKSRLFFNRFIWSPKSSYSITLETIYGSQYELIINNGKLVLVGFNKVCEDPKTIKKLIRAFKRIIRHKVKWTRDSNGYIRNYIKEPKNENVLALAEEILKVIEFVE